MSQLQLSAHHIQGVKNECADYISRNNFDDMIGARFEELVREAFGRMEVHLDLNMTMIRPLDGLQQVEYLKEFGDIYKRLGKRLEPVLVDQQQWKCDKTYLWHGDRIVVPSDRIPALLKWIHESSGHVGAEHTLKLFKKWFHTRQSDDQLRKTLQAIVDKCPCRSQQRSPWKILISGLRTTNKFSITFSDSCKFAAFTRHQSARNQILHPVSPASPSDRQEIDRWPQIRRRDRIPRRPTSRNLWQIESLILKKPTRNLGIQIAING